MIAVRLWTHSLNQLSIYICLIFTGLAFLSPSAHADMDNLYDSVERHFNAAVGPVCVCACAYKKNHNIKVPRYYESGSSPSCSSIEGQACLAVHRGTLYHGTTLGCEEGPRPVDINSGEGEIMKVPVAVSSLS